MPFNFPSVASIGVTYSFGDVTWEYNGYAWEKLDLGGSGSAGPPGPTGATGAPGAGVAGNNDVGVMYLKGNTFETTIPFINAREVVVGGITTGTLYNFQKHATTNSLQYLGAGGRFHVIATFNFETEVSNNTCGFYVGLNRNIASGLSADADRISESEVYIHSSSSSKPVGGALQTIVDLNTNDRIFFIVQNKDAAKYILVEFLKFIAVPLTSERGATGATGAGGLIEDYVVSINGSTGAITNVAKTNTENTFTQLQTFSSGITSNGANFTRGVTLFAGTTSTPPLLFQSGAFLTTPTSGAVEFNNLVFYGTSVAGRGLIPIEHINIINSDYSLSSITTSQQVFPTANMGLNSNTAYLMDGEYVLQTGTIAHTTSVLFDYFTIGSSPTGYFSAKTFAVASSGTITRSVDNVFFDNINGGVVSTSSGSARTVVSFRGIVFVTDACSMVPKISFSVAPGGTNLVKVGSFIKLIPLGTNTMSTIGYWF